MTQMASFSAHEEEAKIGKRIQNLSIATKQETAIFLPKINVLFLSLILQNLNRRSVADNFLENDTLDEPKRCCQAENTIS